MFCFILFSLHEKKTDNDNRNKKDFGNISNCLCHEEAGL